MNARPRPPRDDRTARRIAARRRKRAREGVRDELSAWFDNYHALNPHVYAAFCVMARELRSQGFKRYGAKTIMERLRWESEVRHPGESFKLSNTIKDRCSARYVRMLMSADPSFASFFETRPTSTAASRAKMSAAHRGGPGRVPGA